ncbi:sulfatase/phosphatase domain-containing protein [candidate division KSB1 bacterium]
MKENIKEFSRRDFIKYTGLGAAALTLPSYSNGCKGFTGANKRPNIIFIMSDDHAVNAVSSYGGILKEYAKTPNIDRIGSEGIRFEQSFCTNAICAPCRAVLLTGKYSHENGLLDNSDEFDGSQMTFPKLLQQNGYKTAMVGKWHLKTDPTGFDYWNVLPGQGDYYNPVLIEMGERKNHNGYVTDIITDTALNWMKGNPAEEPFCLLLHHKAPHRNWMPDKKHLHLFDDVDLPVPETFFDDYSTRSEAARHQTLSIIEDMNLHWDLKLKPGENTENLRGLERSWRNKLRRLDEDQMAAWNEKYDPLDRSFREANLSGEDLAVWKYQRYIKDYLRCIISVDENVGRVLDYLDEAGIADNTLIVYTSDQGFFLGEHGWFDKRFMYEESLRMPLLVRYPDRIKKGTVNSDMVVNLDFAPTFLDYAGVPVPEDMQGHSLRPVFEGNTPDDWRTSIYYHYYEYPAAHRVMKHYGIRTDRYKLIHFYDEIDEWELFDLQNDPNEMNNLYGNPEYSDIINKLKEELQELRVQYGDTG